MTSPKCAFRKMKIVRLFTDETIFSANSPEGFGGKLSRRERNLILQLAKRGWLVLFPLMLPKSFVLRGICWKFSMVLLHEQKIHYEWKSQSILTHSSNDLHSQTNRERSRNKIIWPAIPRRNSHPINHHNVCYDGMTCYPANGRFHKHLNKTLPEAFAKWKQAHFNFAHIFASRVLKGNKIFCVMNNECRSWCRLPSMMN